MGWKSEYLVYLGGPGREIYHQTSNINRTLVVNKSIDHSDVVGASPANDGKQIKSKSVDPNFMGWKLLRCEIVHRGS